MRIILNNGRVFCDDVTHRNVTRHTNVTRKPAPVLSCNVVTDRKGEKGENLQNQPKSTYKRHFSNVLTEAENQSNSIGISDEELFKQFEREFLKTGTEGGGS